jgi:hypothetical protein
MGITWVGRGVSSLGEEKKRDQRSATGRLEESLQLVVERSLLGGNSNPRAQTGVSVLQGGVDGSQIWGGGDLTVRLGGETGDVSGLTGFGSWRLGEWRLLASAAIGAS